MGNGQIHWAIGRKNAEMIDAPTDETEDSCCSFPNRMERPLSNLCFNCQNIFSHWEEISMAAESRLPHCVDERALKASADAGCGLCAQFMLDSSEIVPYYSSLYTGRFVAEGDYGDDGNDRVLKGFVWLKTGDKFSFSPKVREKFWTINLILPFLGGFDGVLRVYDDWDEKEPLCVQYVVNLIPTHRQATLYDSQHSSSISTQDALPIAKVWLDRCLAFHKHCNPSENQRLPTRLISIQEECIRLCASEEIQGFPKYVTLSHCWGSMPFETLTKERISELQKRIALDTLPKTFREAINAARYLGFQYIWIDSLCIVQDDPDDWAAESSLMSSVYGGSSLNLAASDAPNGAAGCFFNRGNLWRCQVRVNANHKEELYDCVPKNIRMSLRDTQLAKRCWVVQERILARRTLHFTRTQLFWECHEKDLCETFPEEMPPKLSQYFHIAKRPLTEKNWHQIVSAYSSAKLTYSKDMLIAISGIARLIQLTTKDQYIAGMWKKDLEIQLCWSVYSSGGGQRILPYTAPSWSWASIDTKGGRISLCHDVPYLTVTLCAQVQEISITHATTDQFGETLSANLRLSCKHLIHARFVYGKGGDSVLVAGQAIMVYAEFDSFHLFEGMSVDTYVVPVMYDSWSRLCGLIVKPTSQRTGQYYRVGKFSFFWQDETLEFDNAVKIADSQIEDSEYVEKLVDAEGLRHYVIDII
ncbi:hypothetical protein GLAREA_08387 [Glarea lozoyensis ATCC 20868]|uniref:Heterokaryon incompatibility domain-containing protein n=1 Tax=Glarea lozoyensis (strain ATCC 20868 / MF5171) TaxID=1116229 RepID=S3CEW6_GLAL2|nr:uncharacterized protein GLAREA_08387 [Glarea lozoyensis ATCC 20868]EPE24535.1 hypothetical protein GLAREA_08387 [Glarea lozoyensis ATCC 20868]